MTRRKVFFLITLKIKLTDKRGLISLLGYFLSRFSEPGPYSTSLITTNPYFMESRASSHIFLNFKETRASLSVPSSNLLALFTKTIST
jgi:hypothetical protein